MLGVGFYMLPMARTFHTSQNLGSWRLVPAAVLLASALQSAGLRASQVVTAVHQVTRYSCPLRRRCPCPRTLVMILITSQGRKEPRATQLATSLSRPDSGGSGTNSVVGSNGSHSVPASSTARLRTAIGSLRAGNAQAVRSTRAGLAEPRKPPEHPALQRRPRRN